MGTIKTTNIETITGSGTLTLGQSGETITIPSGVTMSVPSGGLSGQNYPAFEAYLSSNTSVTDAAWVKMPVNTELFDTDSYYDNATNYRFTPLIAGKYFIYASAYCFGSSTNTLVSANVSIYKNGSFYREIYFENTNNYAYTKNPYISAIIDMNGSTDYVEAYVNVNATTATAQLLTGRKSTYFGAYRIGA
jgi:hypothetical protein